MGARSKLAGSLVIAAVLQNTTVARADESLPVGLDEAIQAMSERDWLECATRAQASWTTARHPRAAAILGICEEQLGLYPEAAEHLDHFRRNDDGKDPARSRAIEETWKRVRKEIAVIHLTVSAPGARVAVDGRAPVPAPLTLYVLPGDIRVDATAPGYEPGSFRVKARANSTATEYLVLRRAEPEERPLWPTIALGSTAGIGIVSGLALVFVSTAKETKAHELSARCQDEPCAVAAEKLHDEADAYLGGGLGVFALGGAALVGTMLFVSFASPEAKLLLRLQPLVGTTSGGRLTLEL